MKRPHGRIGVVKKQCPIFFLKFKILKFDIWHLNLPHGRICVIEIDGSDLFLTLGHMAPLGLLKKMAKLISMSIKI
jgi:hypothetical protein